MTIPFRDAVNCLVVEVSHEFMMTLDKNACPIPKVMCATPIFKCLCYERAFGSFELGPGPQGSVKWQASAALGGLNEM